MPLLGLPVASKTDLLNCAESLRQSSVVVAFCHELKPFSFVTATSASTYAERFSSSAAMSLPCYVAQSSTA